MTGREVQLLHLVVLAVGLDVLGRSCTTALSRYDRPVLYVPRGTDQSGAARRTMVLRVGAESLEPDSGGQGAARGIAATVAAP